MDSLPLEELIADENAWHTGQTIRLLVTLSALLHDLGKASEAFQDRLFVNDEQRLINIYRHEWVSLRMFQAFVGDSTDAEWLARLAEPTDADDERWTSSATHDLPGRQIGCPFTALAHAPLAQAIGWLVVTHHRLPALPTHDLDGNGLREDFNPGLLRDMLTKVTHLWNECRRWDANKYPPPTVKDAQAYWHFPKGLPVKTESWRKQAARTAKGLLKLVTAPGSEGAASLLSNPFVIHVSRLCLMLADHHYSSLGKGHPERMQVPKGCGLWANTVRSSGGKTVGNQELDEHLVGVACLGSELAHALPRFDEHLPRLRSRKLRERARDERFRWQDKAAELAASLRERSSAEGGFIVNMASTGSGKTLANARVMHALADPARGMRCAFAMGLRTLTLQTGRAFRDLLGLGDDELAVRVGGSATAALFEHYELLAEATGSASSQSLMEQEEGEVEFVEGNEGQHPLLRRALHNPDIRKLIAAPLLVCTIDHLVPATDGERGGRQIAPMLRLMSGDLVLDEPDDFDLADLPGLTRLVHWAGLLGARVLLSSATLPPDLVSGLFQAYANGRQHFQRNRGRRPGAADRPPNVACLWIDEFNRSPADCATAASFEAAHQAFAMARSRKLAEQAKAQVRRRAKLVDLDITGIPNHADARYAHFASLIMRSAQELHAAHASIDPHAGTSGKRISFGLVRMANINRLYEVALALYRQGAPEGCRIHLCVYHSRYPLLLRSAIERRLDQAMNRRQPDAVFKLPEVRKVIDSHTEPDQLFIVLASPVAEVGRDHDYDWAVVEPSSVRSLIQLAGRVKRHRDEACTTPNIHVFRRNLRSVFGEPGDPVFCKPGFEDRGHMLNSHDLQDLLSAAELEVIDARPRIVCAAPAELKPKAQLIDLEHARMREAMLPPPPSPAATGRPRRRSAFDAVPTDPWPNASVWWAAPPADALTTGALQRKRPFRYDPTLEDDFALVPNEDEDDYVFRMLLERPKSAPPAAPIVGPELFVRLPDEAVQGTRIAPWGTSDYLGALGELAEQRGESLADCAWRFGTVSLRKTDGTKRWRFHPALGFDEVDG